MNPRLATLSLVIKNKLKKIRCAQIKCDLAGEIFLPVPALQLQSSRSLCIVLESSRVILYLC